MPASGLHGDKVVLGHRESCLIPEIVVTQQWQRLPGVKKNKSLPSESLHCGVATETLCFLIFLSC